MPCGNAGCIVITIQPGVLDVLLNLVHGCGAGGRSHEDKLDCEKCKLDMLRALSKANGIRETASLERALPSLAGDCFGIHL